MNPSLILVFISAALTIFALYKIVSPFLEARRDQLRFEVLDDELTELERLVARKSVLLQSLRDIEFDHETGKLSDEDYERLKKKHEHRAVRVMRQLDELRGGVDLDEMIDSALEERLAEKARPDESQERDVQAEKLACPECGEQLEPEDRFCSHCGLKLDEASQSDEDDEAEVEVEDDRPRSEESPEADATAAEEGSDASDRPVSELRSEATT